jgi:type 1 glutamine amidotransferase
MKKALIVQGGWPGHEPKQCADVVAPWLTNQGFDVAISDTLDSYLDADLMSALSLIVPVWTMGDISNEQEAGLSEAVKGGVGLAGFHGGMCDSFRASLHYQLMTGGQFLDHPGGIIDYTVNITRPDDPIVAGIADFQTHSEQYYMHIDPGSEVLATTTFSGEHGDCPWIAGTVMPVVWKRRYGQGRVFYCACGHVARELAMPELETIITRGALWAAKD